MKPGTASPQMVQGIEQVVPSRTPMNVTAVTGTGWARPGVGMREFGAAVPFAGYLLGFAYVGHRVVVFDGHPVAFEPACRGADMLLVDATLVPQLRADWVDVAYGEMR